MGNLVLLSSVNPLADNLSLYAILTAHSCIRFMYMETKSLKGKKVWINDSKRNNKMHY